MNNQESEADTLREWLAGNHTGDGLDDGIRETIFVLSPQRAPLPSKKMEQIFSELRGGPLALLPEEDLLDEVEAVFGALKHDCVSPKRSINDIFASLSEGPLVGIGPSLEKNRKEIGEEASESNVVPLPRSWSTWGTVLAAAAVLMFIFTESFLENSMMLEQKTSTSIMEDQVPVSTPKIARLVEEEMDEEEPSLKEETPLEATSKAPQKKFAQRPKSKNKSLPKGNKGVVFVGESQMDILHKDNQSMKKEMPLKEEMEDAAAQYPVELEVKESLQVPSEAAKSSSVSLKMLRSEALLDNEISRHLAFSALSREKLRVITQGSDSKRMFWASYELAIRFPAELPYLESLLRIKNTNTVEKRNLMILVADIYRNMGQEDKAERLYRDALRLK